MRVQDDDDFERQNKRQISRLRHARFYSTMVLRDMLMDAPLEQMSNFYGMTLGELQAFQTKCTIFASMVTSLCQSLNWWNLYNLLSQFVDRINFSIQDELEDLILELNETDDIIEAKQARAIFEAGYDSTFAISKARAVDIMKAL